MWMDRSGWPMPASCRRRGTSFSDWMRMPLASFSRIRPARVRATFRRSRSKSVTPSSCSSSEICLLSADWETYRLSAARLKFSVSATATK